MYIASFAAICLSRTPHAHYLKGMGREWLANGSQMVCPWLGNGAGVARDSEQEADVVDPHAKSGLETFQQTYVSTRLSRTNHAHCWK